MMWRVAPVTMVVSLILAAGCGSDSGGSDMGGHPDAPAGNCPAAVTPADWTYPAGPYGVQVDDRFEDMTLNDCDGNPVSFGDLLGSGEMVLFNVGAGWCAPCVQEAKIMEAEIHEVFCPRGLRIYQVLFETETGAAATTQFCKEWRDKFGLTFPVVIDPDFTVEPHFSGAGAVGSTPLNLLVDRDGIIRFRAAGPPPADFNDRIDEMLPQ